VSHDDQGRRARSIAIDVRQLAAGDTVVHLMGDLIGDAAAAAMQQILIDQLSRGPRRLIVNLSGVTRIDAIGVHALASAAAVAGEADHAFCLVDGGAGRVRAALAAEQMTELFDVFSSVSEAVHDQR
jgi:anti-anti-sigma regulatory factor